MNLREVFEYYSREDVQNIILEVGKNREVVGVFRNGSYSPRPNVIIYPNDITAMVREGVIEFHCSLERWSQPMSLKTDNYEQLRTGWDLVLDLDCEVFEHGKIAAEVFCNALKKHGIKNFSLKFTGGTGFHIAVPWECFPKTVDYKPVVKMFPELPRTIGLYLKQFVREELESRLLKAYTIEDLSSRTGKPLEEITANDSAHIINPFKIVDVDPVLISPRHLFRMPYSLNKNTGFVSLPIKQSQLKEFKREDADHRIVKVDTGYLKPGEENEAGLLVSEAVDWWSRRKTKETKKQQTIVKTGRKFSEDAFPPCAKNILKGLSDGRKRAVFILITLLRSLGWNWKETEQMVYEWNAKNKPPLRENYIRSQLRWHQQQKRNLLPPRCEKEGWYESFGVCEPDSLCGPDKSVKNPVNYPFRKTRKKKSF